MTTDATDKILDTINSLAKETNALKEEELVNLFEYLTVKDTNKSDVEKFLASCPSNNAKLSYLRAISKKSESGMFVSPVIFANNTEYLLILVLFFPASYRQPAQKTHSCYRRATRC